MSRDLNESVKTARKQLQQLSESKAEIVKNELMDLIEALYLLPSDGDSRASLDERLFEFVKEELNL